MTLLTEQRRVQQQRYWLRQLAALENPFTVAESVGAMRIERYSNSWTKCENFLRELRDSGVLDVISPPWSKPFVMWWSGETVPPTFTAPARWEPEERALNVYYGAKGDLIKIGYSGQVRARMAHLGCELLATEPGGRELERRRHQQFATERVTPRQEWFRPTPTLLAHIRDLLANAAVAS